MKDQYKVAINANYEDVWKSTRRRYVTASDILKFLPEDVLLKRGWWIEQWMARDQDGEDRDMVWLRRDILDMKLTGREPVFPDPTKILWGFAEEGHFRDRFEEYTGLEVEPDHSMVTHGRWPYLSATLDAWIMKTRKWGGPRAINMFVNPVHVLEAIEQIPVDKKVLLEMKTTSDYGITPWLSGKRTAPRSKIIYGKFTPQPAGVPVYYRPQVLTQMAITGMTECVVVCQGGLSNMTAHTVKLDPGWLEVLDRVNQDVKDNMDDIRSVLDGKE